LEENRGDESSFCFLALHLDRRWNGTARSELFFAISVIWWWYEPETFQLSKVRLFIGWGFLLLTQY
jgi:hypothetical protein